MRFLLDSARARPGGTGATSTATVGTALRLLERHPAFARVRVKSRRCPRRLPAARIEPTR